MTRRNALTGVMAAALTMFATSIFGAEDRFPAIPTDAHAFVAVNHLKESDGKLQKLAQRVQAPALSVLALAKATTGVQKGLDEAGTAAVVVMPGVGFKAEPVVVIFVPVTDYQEFVKAWGLKKVEKVSEISVGAQNLVVAQRGTHAIFTEQEHREVLQQVLDSKQSIHEAHPQFAAWLRENDVVAVATNHGVKKASHVVQEQIKQTKAALENADPDIIKHVGPTLAMMDFYAQLFQRAEKEVAIIGAAGKLDKEGNLRIGTRTRFISSGSSRAAALSSVKPLAESPLTGLPGGMFALAGGGPWSTAMVGGLAKFQTGVMLQTFYGLEPKQAEEYWQLTSKNCEGIKSLALFMGPGEPGQPIVSDMVAVYDIDNAPRFLDNLEKQIQMLSEATKKAEKPFGVYTIKKATVAGHAGLEMEMEFKQNSDDAHGALVKQQLEKMLGVGGKLKTYFAAVGEHRVAVSIGNTASVLRIAEAMQKPDKSLAHDAEVKKTTALLPPDAQWSGFVSPNGLIVFWKRVIETMIPAGVPMPKIPDFPASPPIGIAVKAAPGELRTEAVLPAAVIEAIGQYVSKARGAMNPEAL